MAQGEFSVYQFFEDTKKPDDTYEAVLQFVDAETAVLKAKFLTTNVSAKIGITKRVIITDGGDCIAFEWRHGEGVVFPPNEETIEGE